MQEGVLKKNFRNVRQSLFRAFPWSPKGNLEQVVTRSTPIWVELKDLPADFWPFIPQILRSLRNVMQIENSRATLPHLNARILIALQPEVNFPDRVSLDIESDRYN